MKNCLFLLYSKMVIKINCRLLQTNYRKMIEIITDFKIATSKINGMASYYPHSFRRKVTNQHIDAVKEFLIKHKGEHFIIDMIQFYLKEEYLELSMISDLSIRRILNQNLKYSNKKICLVHKKIITLKCLRVFFESAYSLASLEERDYEFTYLDEFSLNFKNKSVYGWGPKGNNGFRYNYTASMKMSFMIGFSINRVYRIFGTTTTHNHKSFAFFVSNILEYRTNILSMSESKFIIVWDNSSMHKSKEIMKYLKKSKVIILTIWPYSPALNPAKKMILYLR